MIILRHKSKTTEKEDGPMSGQDRMLNLDDLVEVGGGYAIASEFVSDRRIVRVLRAKSHEELANSDMSTSSDSIIAEFGNREEALNFIKQKLLAEQQATK